MLISTCAKYYIVHVHVYCFLEISPASSCDAHTVLVVDLLNTEQHGTISEKAIAANGHVSLGSTQHYFHTLSSPPSLSIIHTHTVCVCVCVCVCVHSCVFTAHIRPPD